MNMAYKTLCGAKPSSTIFQIHWYITKNGSAKYVAVFYSAEKSQTFL